MPSQSPNTQSLIDSIDPLELTAAAPPLTAWQLGLVDSADAVAALLSHGGPVSAQGGVQHGLAEQDTRPDPSYWTAIKAQMHIFLCTDDERYRELWRRIDALENKTTGTLVGLIATALGASIGVAATLVAGFVAVSLYAVIKLGKEAYCVYAAPAPAAA